MLGVFLIALLILILAAAAAAATRRRQPGRAAGELARQPKDVERDVYEKLYGSHSSEGTISEAARETRPTPGRLASAHTEAEPRLVTTRDGSRLSVRPIKRLTEGDVRYFTEVDHRDHDGLIALTSDDEIVAVGTGSSSHDAPAPALRAAARGHDHATQLRASRDG